MTTPSVSFLISACVILFVNSTFGYISSRSQGVASSSNADGNKAFSHVHANGANPGDGADGSTQGNPATFTWSIVPDTTSYYTGSSATGTERISAIVSYYDEEFSVPLADRGSDLTNRPWFPGFSEGLDIISRRCGVTYIYEPNDDGADVFLVASAANGEQDPGIAGVRGDFRIAGSSDLFAGGLSTTAIGNIHHPEAYLKINSFNANSSIRFVIMHETLHALGFSHSTVNSSSNQSGVTGAGGTSNGPQFDDICGLHRKYGDFFEKNGGNDLLGNATDLGSVAAFGSLIIGDDANDTTVALDEFDFISIDDDSDTDFLKFTVEREGEFTLTLDPRGPTYTNYGTDWATSFREANTQTIVADEINDLQFRLYESSGNLIQTISSSGLGESETLVTNLVAGDYYVEVSGVDPDPALAVGTIQFAGAQLYAFEVRSNSFPPAVANSESVTTISDSPIHITLSGSDPDPAVSTLNYLIDVLPENGVLSGTAPDLLYTPDGNFVGSDSFTFTVNDSIPATVSITVFGPPETLVGYDFDDGTGTATFAAAVQNINIQASDFGVGSGFLAPIDTSTNALAENTDAEGNILGTNNPISFGGNRNNLGFTRQGNLANALDENEYLTFTATPVNGVEMNLFSFTFRRWIQTLTESPNSWALYSSLDHFGSFIASGETTETETWVGHVIDLSAPQFSGLSEAVEFRLYLYNGRNNSGSFSLIDKVVLNGTVTASSGFEAFLADHPNFTDSSFGGDGNGNGISNGIEYAFGSAAISNNSIVPDLVFTFERNAASVTDTTQRFQYSEDLVSWIDLNLTGVIPSEVSIGETSDGIDPISVTLDNVMPPHRRLFWRLNVELNE